MSDCCSSDTKSTGCCGESETATDSCCGAGADPSAASSCCGGTEPAGDDYPYGPQPFEIGELATLLGPVPRVATELNSRDLLGEVRVRAGIRRAHYRVRPGLYAVGEPDDTAPVLVTSNFKLTFDAVRRELSGLDAWILVLDTKGVNVWCAAGKGTFSTAELVARMRAVSLEQVVSHRKLILPQLGATGVAAHEVRARSGFSVIWGPVRAGDLMAFLAAHNQATPQMRRVTFTTRERMLLTGVELSVLWRPRTLMLLAVAAVIAVAASLWMVPLAAAIGVAAAFAVTAVVAGALLVPLLLPWVPGRAFALKGALVGAVAAGLVAIALRGAASPSALAGLAAVSAALASYVAMNFTGASTFTSPSGVEWEMRRAIPWQLAGLIGGLALALFGIVMGWRS